MKAIIYLAQGVGLANRLRALVGYQAMSHFLNVPLYLCWVSDSWCDVDFTHLFDCTTIKTINPMQLKDFRMDNAISIFDSHEWFDKIWKTHLEQIVPWLDFSRQAKLCLRNLYLNRNIADKIEHFSKLYHMHSAAGIHIRWTDNLENYKIWTDHDSAFDPSHISKLSGFQNFIERQTAIEPNLTIFLATDNIEIEMRFRKLYPNHIVVYPKKNRRRTISSSWREFKFRCSRRTSSIEDALIDMVLLSRCKIILGTYFSSYSKLSAVWGNVNYFEVRGVEYERNNFVDSLRQR